MCGWVWHLYASVIKGTNIGKETVLTNRRTRMHTPLWRHQSLHFHCQLLVCLVDLRGHSRQVEPACYLRKHHQRTRQHSKPRHDNHAAVQTHRKHKPCKPATKCNERGVDGHFFQLLALWLFWCSKHLGDTVSGFHSGGGLVGSGLRLRQRQLAVVSQLRACLGFVVHVLWCALCTH